MLISRDQWLFCLFILISSWFQAFWCVYCPLNFPCWSSCLSKYLLTQLLNMTFIGPCLKFPYLPSFFPLHKYFMIFVCYFLFEWIFVILLSPNFFSIALMTFYYYSDIWWFWHICLEKICDKFISLILLPLYRGIISCKMRYCLWFLVQWIKFHNVLFDFMLKMIFMTYRKFFWVIVTW